MIIWRFVRRGERRLTGRIKDVHARITVTAKLAGAHRFHIQEMGPRLRGGDDQIWLRRALAVAGLGGNMGLQQVGDAALPAGAGGAEPGQDVGKGVYAPRLGKLPTIGQSGPGDASALLGFSPVLNGPRDAGSVQGQGFEMSLVNGGVDPINVFPVGPQNDNRSASNNYSPMWDAHVSQWTAAAIKSGKARRIVSLADLKGLIKQGLVESAFINPPAPGNAFVGGLRPTGAIINCPVIAQPDLPPR